MAAIQKPLRPMNAGRAARRKSRRARRAQRHSRVENLFLGTALAAFGVAAWGYQQERAWADDHLDWWPLLLVWIGIGKLLAGRFAGGIALVTGGGLAFLHLQGLADLEYTWPLILVAVGVVITLSALVGKDGPFSDDGPDILPADEAAADGAPDESEETNHG